MVVWYFKGYYSEPIKANKISLYGTWDSQFNQNSSTKEATELTTGRSPLLSAVHVNCLWTANLLFVEVIQNQKRFKMHAINDPSSAEDSCTYWVPVFYLKFLMSHLFAWYLTTSVLISVPKWLKSIGSGTHTAVKWLSSLYAKVSSPHLNVSW